MNPHFIRQESENLPSHVLALGTDLHLPILCLNQRWHQQQGSADKSQSEEPLLSSCLSTGTILKPKDLITSSSAGGICRLESDKTQIRLREQWRKVNSEVKKGEDLNNSI